MIKAKRIYHLISFIVNCIFNLVFVEGKCCVPLLRKEQISLQTLLLFISSLSTTKIEERVKQLLLLPTLLSQPEEFCTRMQEGIYPLIEGSDHASLLYYYTLLQGSEIEGSIHSPEVHVKLLKKIKNGVPSELKNKTFLCQRFQYHLS